MLLTRYEPWHAMARLHHQINQILGDELAVPAAGSTSVAKSDSAATWLPNVDVHEEADKFVVRADLPGVDAKDISITADKGVLTLSGQRQLERRDEQQGAARYERIEGRFLRRFTLPDNVQTSDIRARHNNGVLEVTIPKVPAVEPRRVAVETH